MEDDDDIRCAILTGDDSGGAFSAGANLKNPKTHTMESTAALIKSIPKRKHRAFEMLGNFPKPLIGAVNGYAVGIGCIVTFCCDLLVASERAEWRLPQAALGILPAYGGAVRLARWVGKGPRDAPGARRPAARRRGVPHRPGPVAGAARQADGQGAGGGGPRRLAAAAGRAAREGIARCAASTSRTWPTPRSSTSTASRSLELTEDKAEGHRAWREKRKPVFRGR